MILLDNYIMHAFLEQLDIISKTKTNKDFVICHRTHTLSFNTLAINIARFAWYEVEMHWYIEHYY